MLSQVIPLVENHLTNTTGSEGKAYYSSLNKVFFFKPRVVSAVICGYAKDLLALQSKSVWTFHTNTPKTHSAYVTNHFRRQLFIYLKMTKDKVYAFDLEHQKFLQTVSQNLD